MADRQISELVAATQINAGDLFVLEQNSSAKKLTGQVLINWMTSYADGHGGIQTIAKTSTVGLVDTYTVTYADTTTSTFTVTNGAQGAQGQRTYVWIKYADQNPSSDADMKNTPSAWMGIYTGTESTAPTTYTSYTWGKIKGEQGNTGSPLTITSSSVNYVQSSSGTVVPASGWSINVPSVTQGNFLWTRTTNVYSDNTSVVSYGVSHAGIDGSGSVVSVNGESPDLSGNVTVYGDDILLNNQSATSVSDEITSHEENGTVHVTSSDKTAWNGKAKSYLVEGLDVTTQWVQGTGQYTQQVLVNGLLATDKPVDIYWNSTGAEDKSAAYDAYNMIAEASSGAGAITLTVLGDTAPATAFKIDVKWLR